MAIDVYFRTTDSNPSEQERIWSIGDQEFSELGDVFAVFTRRTGKKFDQYGDLEFPAGTFAPLNDSIREAISNNPELQHSETVTKLVSLVEDAEEKNCGLSFVGD